MKICPAPVQLPTAQKQKQKLARGVNVGCTALHSVFQRKGLGIRGISPVPDPWSGFQLCMLRIEDSAGTEAHTRSPLSVSGSRLSKLLLGKLPRNSLPMIAMDGLDYIIDL